MPLFYILLNDQYLLSWGRWIISIVKKSQKKYSVFNYLQLFPLHLCRQLTTSRIMKHKDGKPAPQGDKSLRLVPMSIMFLVLCGCSFYLGGIFCSEKSRFDTKNVVSDVQSPKVSIVTPLQKKHVEFPECSSDYQDYTPCTDPRVLLIFMFLCCSPFGIQDKALQY